jgi:hypothetical protein
MESEHVCVRSKKVLCGTLPQRGGIRRLFLGLFFGGGQNIKNQGVFAAARLDVGPFFFYLFFIFWLLF